jgi:hypothetical protein
MAGDETRQPRKAGRATQHLLLQFVITCTVMDTSVFTTFARAATPPRWTGGGLVVKCVDAGFQRLEAWLQLTRAARLMEGLKGA